MIKKINSINFFSGIKEELKKVTWPSKKETFKLTLIVIVVSLIIGVYIGIIDILLTKALQLVAQFR